MGGITELRRVLASHQKHWLPPNSSPVGLQHLLPSASSLLGSRAGQGELWELLQSQHSSEVRDEASLLGFVLSSNIYALFFPTNNQNKIKTLSITAVGIDTKITLMLF